MRFLLIMTLFILGVGFFLYSQIEIPYLGWLGHLPGDLIIRNHGMIIYLPLTTSLIFSIIISILSVSR